MLAEGTSLHTGPGHLPVFLDGGWFAPFPNLVCFSPDLFPSVRGFLLFSFLFLRFSLLLLFSPSEAEEPKGMTFHRPYKAGPAPTTLSLTSEEREA